ncbi:LysR family transcriptional regulator [Lachnospiraceae bacterium]|uniref:LysR family transcriptional regulator n=1 Tax=Extibacter sp. GGCC_0201 TaxID=2731209 RepID=UPI001AA0C040|nr:LysR family transcriptional regulator [Extibacter sp. GGCC_0201]MBO1719737.1 LysR family transcriptional regulator [Extibacter sp. GGCC_0201]BDF33765.1 LysR family transcriptional regulator [Lachnospiraceae bacterium]BDF37770.1 LysR family transcriptional regulator [Lachnospiraceae bacterium]
MNIHELNYVICIAKHQNITKAAQELFISQPTLSKHLKKMERDLGLKLFNRIDNCYIPTYAGRRYMEYASKVLALTQDWEKELLDLLSLKDGELTVAFPLMRSSCMLPFILPAFHRLHPHVKVHFLEETHAIQERLLEDSKIDFAVFSEETIHPKLDCETLGREEILLVVSQKHSMAKGLPDYQDARGYYPTVDWEMLKDETFILNSPEQNTGAVTARLLKEHYVNPSVSFYTRNTQAALLLVQHNEGLCFAPETYVRSTAFDLPPVCFSLGDERAFTSTVAAYRKGAYLPIYARDFIRSARDYFVTFTKCGRHPHRYRPESDYRQP